MYKMRPYDNFNSQNSLKKLQTELMISKIDSNVDIDRSHLSFHIKPSVNISMEVIRLIMNLHKLCILYNVYIRMSQISALENKLRGNYFQILFLHSKKQG